MSDNPTPNDVADATESQESKPEDNGFDPITSQEQLDKLISKRLERERAKFSDYDELKAKAAEAADSRSEVEKLNDRLAELEVERHQASVDAAKAKAAAEYGVPADLLVGDDVDAVTAHAERLAEYVKSQAPDAGAYVGNVGRDADVSSAEGYARRMLAGD